MNKKIHIIKLLFILIYVLQSCNNVTTETLEQAGSNKTQLIAAINHYRDSTQLQYEAVLFLVKNMQDHKSQSSLALDSIVCYIDSVQSPLSDKKLEQIWMSLHSIDSPIIKYDANSLSASDIIDNVDVAYKTWIHTPWRKQVSFDIFCNYILPHRVANEPFIRGWRNKLSQQYRHCIAGITDVVKAYERVHCEVTKRFRDHPLGIPYIPALIHLGSFGTGSCMQGCAYEVAVMRSLGIPATIDFVTHWSNYSQNGHAWCVLALNDISYSMTQHDTIASRYNVIGSSIFPKPEKLESAFPYPCNFKKRISKVWRQTYTFNQTDYDDTEAPAEVYSFFSNPHIYDITDQYIIHPTAIEPNQFFKDETKYVYLCTYRTGKGWYPIAYSKDSLSYGCIADSVVYLQAYYHNGNLTPVSAPLLTGSDALQFQLIPDYTNLITIAVDRKYPLVGKFIDRWSKMRGCRIEASNNPEFLDPFILATIDKTPKYRNVYVSKSSIPFRYVRYISRKEINFPISELEFYGNGEILSGIPFSEGIETPERAFDKDPFKILDNATSGYQVGLDLCSPYRIDSIVLFPQNDDNFVKPFTSYELQCFDSTWISLEKITSSGYSITFKDVPSNALFRLHCPDGGNEERIFTWENNRQVWW